MPWYSVKEKLWTTLRLIPRTANHGFIIYALHYGTRWQSQLKFHLQLVAFRTERQLACYVGLILIKITFKTMGSWALRHDIRNTLVDWLPISVPYELWLLTTCPGRLTAISWWHILTPLLRACLKNTHLQPSRGGYPYLGQFLIKRFSKNPSKLQ